MCTCLGLDGRYGIWASESSEFRARDQAAPSTRRPDLASLSRYRLRLLSPGPTPHTRALHDRCWSPLGLLVWSKDGLSSRLTRRTLMGTLVLTLLRQSGPWTLGLAGWLAGSSPSRHSGPTSFSSFYVLRSSRSTKELSQANPEPANRRRIRIRKIRHQTAILYRYKSVLLRWGA